MNQMAHIGSDAAVELDQFFLPSTADALVQVGVGAFQSTLTHLLREGMAIK
jgi:hypothetical protein